MTAAFKAAVLPGFFVHSVGAFFHPTFVNVVVKADGSTADGNTAIPVYGILRDYVDPPNFLQVVTPTSNSTPATSLLTVELSPISAKEQKEGARADEAESTGTRGHIHRVGTQGGTGTICACSATRIVPLVVLDSNMNAGDSNMNGGRHRILSDVAIIFVLSSRRHDSAGLEKAKECQGQQGGTCRAGRGQRLGCRRCRKRGQGWRHKSRDRKSQGRGAGLLGQK